MTAAETPVKEKEDEDDSMDREFDMYFASHILPHTNDDRRGIISRGSRKNSFKYRSLMDAKKVSVPSPPAQNSRRRNKTPASHNPAKSKSKSTTTNEILPQKLLDKFENEIEISLPMVDIDLNESSPNTKSTSIPKVVAESLESPDESEENEASVLKNILGLFKFDNALIDAVDESQTDFNRMLNRMSSAARVIPLETPFGDETTTIASWPGSEVIGTAEMEGKTTDSETTASKTIDRVIAYLSHLRRQTDDASYASSKTIDRIVNYLSRLRRTVDETYETHSSEYTHGTTGASICLEKVTNRMSTLALAFSSAAEEATEKTAEQFQENGVCSMMECTSGTSNVAMNQSIETSYSPLDRSWFIVNDDSDTVSRLSLPNEANMISLQHEEYCF